MTEELFPRNENNPILYIIRYLFSFYDNENRKENEKKRRLYSQIMRIATKGNGEIIMKHLLDFNSCTVYELVESYDIPYATADRTVKLLERGEVVKMVGTVGIPYWNGSGKPIKIYLINGADSIYGVEAQQRYGELVRRSVGCLNHEDLEKAVNIVKTYLEKYESRRIPDNKIIAGLMRENGVKGVPIGIVIRALTKEGYDW